MTPVIGLMFLAAATFSPMSVQPSVAGSLPSMTTEFDGHRMHYVDMGKGPALILIHGLGADSSRWQANVAALAENHRVIALDLLGFGNSDKPYIDYRAQIFVNQIFSLMEKLEISKASLVGNSMGAWVSLLFAEQHPDKTEGLILVAPAFVFGLPDSVSAELLATGASPSTPEAMKAYLTRIYHNPDLSEAAVSAALAKKLTAGDKTTIQSVAASLSNRTDVFMPERLRNIRAQTLLIHGTSDGVVPVSASQHIADLLPNADLVLLPEAGHWPQLERADQFNQHVISWLDRNPKVAVDVAP